MGASMSTASGLPTAFLLGPLHGTQRLPSPNQPAQVAASLHCPILAWPPPSPRFLLFLHCPSPGPSCPNASQTSPSLHPQHQQKPTAASSCCGEPLPAGQSAVYTRWNFPPPPASLSKLPVCPQILFSLSLRPPSLHRSALKVLLDPKICRNLHTTSQHPWFHSLGITRQPWTSPSPTWIPTHARSLITLGAGTAFHCHLPTLCHRLLLTARLAED